MADRQQLEAELRQVEETINIAYWNFTRQKRAKPPVLVVPEAYTRRKEIQEILRSLRKAESV